MTNLHVLLVDDEEAFVSALAERLELRGLSVAQEKSGEDALIRVQKEPFDVMVVDLLMPGMDGITLLKHLRSAGLDIPVILLTGHGSSKEGIAGMKYGAFDYLMKPVAFDDLLAKIQQAAGNRG